MTPIQFKARRLALEETQAELAERLGIATRTLRSYEAGERKISEPVARLLDTFLRGHENRIAEQLEILKKEKPQ